MDSSARTFTIWTELENWSRNDFLIGPIEVNGENVFRVNSGDETLGVLHKTFENTWEWIEGDLTLQDAERIGDEIDIYDRR